MSFKFAECWDKDSVAFCRNFYGVDLAQNKQNDGLN